MTKKKISNLAAYVACIGLVVAWTANAGLAANKVNYSGKYSLQGRKTTSGNETNSTLDVLQNEDGIEITSVEQGRRTTNRYPLNGSEGDYTSPGGVSGKCKAQLKDKYLVLESVVISRPQPSAPPVRIHTKERWQLSADSKTLTVKSDVEFPDFPGDISAVVGASGSGTQKYLRTENP
jgi:hypothetical protein